MRHKFDFFFRKNKHRSFPQADAVVFGGHSQVCPITQDKFRLSLQYLNNKKKKRGMRLIFCKQINVKSFLQVVSVNFRGYGQSCSKCKNFFFLILNLKFFISRNVKESINKSNYLARQTI